MCLNKTNRSSSSQSGHNIHYLPRIVRVYEQDVLCDPSSQCVAYIQIKAALPTEHISAG